MIEEFRIRLNYALNLRGMKPIDLAIKLNINRAIISQYLSGRYKPNQQRIVQISEILDVNPVWLMGFDVSIDKKNEQITQDEFVKETLKLLDKTFMNQDKKNYLIQTIKMIGDKNE